MSSLTTRAPRSLSCSAPGSRWDLPSPLLFAAVREQVPRVALHSHEEGQQHGWVRWPFSFLVVPTTLSNFC